MTRARWTASIVFSAALLVGGVALGQPKPLPSGGDGGHSHQPPAKFPMSTGNYSHFVDKFIEMVKKRLEGRGGTEMRVAIDKWVLEVRACSSELIARGGVVRKAEGIRCVTLPLDAPKPPPR